jgi:siroheme synthase (precorrin-2 oxidase/ferrochelatase)
LNEKLSLEQDIDIPIASKPAGPLTIGYYCRGASIIVSDLRNEKLNKAIFRYAQKHNILCNIVDNKPLCNIWFTSVISASHVTASLSTQGLCAFYARKMREELEDDFYTRNNTAQIMTAVRDAIPPEKYYRKPIMEAVYADKKLKALLCDAEYDEARQHALQLCRTEMDHKTGLRQISAAAVSEKEIV